MTDTLEYYRKNADAFFSKTSRVDMSALYQMFLARVPAGGLLVDAGCGSGRDINAFRQLGYRVRAFDACPELAILARRHTGQEVVVRSFADVDELDLYD